MWSCLSIFLPAHIPKGVVSAFGFYSKDNRERIKTENSLVNSARITELCSQEWQKCWGEERKRYEDMHIEDKKRHSKEKEEYELQHGQIIEEGTRTFYD
jgi:hypothetical protein